MQLKKYIYSFFWYSWKYEYEQNGRNYWRPKLSVNSDFKMSVSDVKQSSRLTECSFAFASAQSGQHLCRSLPRQFDISSFYISNFMTLASFCSWAGRFETCLVENPEDRFSRDEVHVFCLVCYYEIPVWIWYAEMLKDMSTRDEWANFTWIFFVQLSESSIQFNQIRLGGLSILISWMSPFPMLGVSGVPFHFYSISHNNSISRGAVATSENTDCGVHEWNKIQSYTEKLKFSVCFMLLLAIFMFYLHVNSHVRKLTFPSHFASISPCSACLVGLIWGKNVVLYLENEPKYHFNN